MNPETMISDDSLSDDDEEEELDPRIQDELEKLNAATNSINHLEAELDEARAVFRQTLAGATYHLNNLAQKLGKCVEKSRPFYESYRQLRQSHGMLQKSSNQFERASGMHIAAKTRVMEAEKRVFGGGPKRAFDTALQEMLNQATIEVNEAEKLKRDSWKQHQEDLKAYRDLETKVKKLYKKLKSSVDKAKPYFEQKRDFDRHLWQLKLRVDSIQIGLVGAKENYSACLKSLETISDDIHEKRKCKRMESMLSKLHERESGVGADSSTEEETSLTASNLDLDFDTSLNFDKLDGISDDGSIHVGDWPELRAASCSDLDNLTHVGASMFAQDTKKPPSEPRVVYGLESTTNESKVNNPEHSKIGEEINAKEKEENDITQSHTNSNPNSQETEVTDYVVKIQIGEESEIKDKIAEENESENMEEKHAKENDLEKHDQSNVVEKKSSEQQIKDEGIIESTPDLVLDKKAATEQAEKETKTDHPDFVEQTLNEYQGNKEQSLSSSFDNSTVVASQDKTSQDDPSKLTDHSHSVDKTSENQEIQDQSKDNAEKDVEEISQEQSPTNN